MERVVSSSALVSFEGNRYSVPPTLAGQTVTVRVRFADLTSVTRSVTLDAPIAATAILAEIADELVRGVLSDHSNERFISLLAISVSHLERSWDLQLELPLALPVLLAGLRIVTVQAIGLAVVAALIGAGGLGTFVFEGLGQYAVDLVLLGALPAIFLALAADYLFQIVAAILRRRFER